MTYRPAPLNTQKFVLREKAAAALSHAETELVRAEGRVLASPNAAAVRKALLRFEALASIRVDGAKVKLASIQRLEVAGMSAVIFSDKNELLQRLIESDGLNGQRGLLEAFRYMQTIEWIAKTITPRTVILPKTILDIRLRYIFGPARRRAKVKFRTTACEPTPLFTSQETVDHLYEPPAPEEVHALIDDYCNFVNRDLFSPTAQAAISHFQIEAIKPFADHLDGCERALSHMVFYKRGLLRSIVAPLALGPARMTKTHAHNMIPYQVGQPVASIYDTINSGALFELCAHYTELAADSINIFLKTVCLLEEKWRAQVGKIEKGSTVDLLLHVLPGMPLVTIATAMQMVGRSFSATNDALGRLKAAGVVQTVKPLQKNRAFEAVEATKTFEKLEERIIPCSPIARDELSSL